MEGSNYGWSNGYKGKKLKHSQKVINSKKNTTKNSFSNAMKGKDVKEDCVAGDFGGMAPANVHSITTYGHTSKTVTGKRRNKRMKKTNDPVKEEVLSTIDSAIKQGVVTESQIKNLFEEDAEDETMTIGEISSEDLTNDLFDTLSDWVIECAEENGISDEDLDLDNLYDDIGMFVDNYIEENEDKPYESESDIEEELYEYFKDKYDPEDYFPEGWDDED